MSLPRPSLLGTLLLGLATAAAGCGGRVGPDLARKFQEAQRVFEEASSPEGFLKAAALYQEILDAGVVSGAVLYNQGNAFMRAGRHGRAIASYRQAMRYRPLDGKLEANLNAALAAAGAPAPRPPLLEYFLFWQDWISYPGKFVLAATVAAGTFTLGVLALLLRPRWYRRLAITGLFLTLLLAFSAGYDWYRFDHQIHGVVVDQEVIARKGNAETYQPAFTEPLAEGTEFQLLQRRGRWLHVQMAGGQDGWVEQEAVVLY